MRNILRRFVSIVVISMYYTIGDKAQIWLHVYMATQQTVTMVTTEGSQDETESHKVGRKVTQSSKLVIWL